MAATPESSPNPEKLAKNIDAGEGLDENVVVPHMRRPWKWIKDNDVNAKTASVVASCRFPCCLGALS